MRHSLMGTDIAERPQRSAPVEKPDRPGSPLVTVSGLTKLYGSRAAGEEKIEQVHGVADGARAVSVDIAAEGDADSILAGRSDRPALEIGEREGKSKTTDHGASHRCDET